jgi:hypothetical protein
MRTPLNGRFITLNGTKTDTLPDETLLRAASRNRIQNPTLYDPIDYFRQRKVRLNQEKASPRRHAGRASV